VPAAGTVLPGAQDVVLHTEDDLRLGAWLVPAEEPSRDITVLVANGNAGDRAGRAPLAAALAARGLEVLVFDYRGYGGNPGSPSGEGLARDARAAYRFLVEEHGASPDRIVYFGESLGAAVVARLAAEHPAGGLVLRSPFVDLASVGKVHYPFLPVRALLRDRFPVVDHLRDVSAPVIVVYGERDSVVPPGQSRAVAEAAPQLLDVIEVSGADHNDLSLLDGTELIDAVVAVADHIEPRP
jgi:fermentation-respiration switch protein FrsA (DUF1100 family)